MYTVSLELPDLCDPGDWQHDEPTPVDAVEAFIAAMTGGVHQWAYVVVDDSTHKRYLVDMAAGPSVKELT